MKAILLFALCAVVGHGSHGQAWIGNRAGIGLYQQRIEADGTLPPGSVDGLTTLTAPTLTLPIEISLSGHFSLLVEPGFVQRGSRTESTGSVATERVNSLEAVMLAKGRIASGRWTPYVVAGPSVTRSLSVRYTNTTTIGNSTQEEEIIADTDDLGSYERTYVSLHAGAGVACSFGAPRVFAEYRAMWGMTPVQRISFTDTNGNTLREAEVFVTGHVFSIGWSIPLSRKDWRATPAQAPTAEPVP